MPSPMLTVTGLTKYFNGFSAVNDISFTLERGEILGFLGPNGAGKTTAIRMILGILNPSAGKISFSFDGSSALDKGGVGYLPEDRGLYEDAKVLDTLVYLAALKRIPAVKAKRLASDWLDTMNLKDYANQKLEKLSKGMQQKVQFIAAILHSPELVVLDEPFSGLDPINQDFLKDLISQLRRQGTTILLSAHQMNLVQELCSRIFLIDKGSSVLHGTLEEIRDQHEENSVELSYSNPGGLEDYLHSLEGVRGLSLSANHARFKLDVAVAPNRFLREIESVCTLKSIKVEKPDLHEIFISAVGEGGKR